MVLRITVLPLVVNFLACASDSSGESSPPELLQLLPLLLVTLLYQRIQRNRYQTWRPFLAWEPS
jgi:hypothetical protein